MSFETGEGSAVQQQKVKSGDKLPAFTPPEYPGYTLEGWYTSENFDPSTKFDVANDPVTKTMTLYAN